MKKIKTICIIGTGYSAYNHYKSFKNLVAGKIYILTRKKKNNKNLKKFNSKKTEIIEGLQSIPKHIDAFIVASHWLKNDYYFNYFRNDKRPILFEKPIGVYHKNFHRLLKFKSNKFVGLNRRCFDTILFLKKYLQKKKISDININICENIKSFQNRFKIKKKNIFLFSSIHNVDLIVYLFGYPSKIKKINSFLDKIEKIGFFIFYYKNFKIKITFLNNYSENSVFTIRLKNSETITLTQNTNLKIFSGLDIVSENNNKVYRPKLKKEFQENNKHKYGYFQQANLFLKNKLTSSIDSYKLSYNILNKLS